LRVKDSLHDGVFRSFYSAYLSMLMCIVALRIEWRKARVQLYPQTQIEEALEEEEMRRVKEFPV
jgi:hypothetical protein